MNYKSNNNEGYILILTLMLLALLVVVVSSMFLNETAHSALATTIIKREKAKLLALSGVQLALDKLTIKKEKDSKEQKSPDDKKNVNDKKDDKDKEKKISTDKSKNEGDSTNKKFLNKILPILNRFQLIKLEQNIDGVEGQIKYCICSEQGKLNINYLFDFSTHKFLQEKEVKAGENKVLEEIFKKINQITGAKDLLNSLRQYLQKRKYPLNDITELLEIKEFEYFNDKVFFQKSDSKKNIIYLTDLFTTWSNTEKIQPLLFSNSLATILGLNIADDKSNKEKNIEEVIKNFKPGKQWKTEWNKILKPIYGKDFETLIKGIENIFDNQFSPKTFSVISYGSIGDIIQKAFAIIEIDSNEAIAKIKKLYWI